MTEWVEVPMFAGARAQAARFCGDSGTEDWVLLVWLDEQVPNPERTLEKAWLTALNKLNLPTSSTLLRRVHCKNPKGSQQELLDFARKHPGAFTFIGQPPIGGNGFALMSQHLLDPSGPIRCSGQYSDFCCQRGNLSHQWLCGLTDDSPTGVAGQASSILTGHDRQLEKLGLTLSRNVVRTWWYLKNIDRDYEAFVDVRRKHFESHGLDSSSRYIASTGIAGSHAGDGTLISLDSYSIGGLQTQQVEHLNAPEHMGPTHDYGVTFERATAISYRDRRHILISGTASINPSGEILHPGNSSLQFDRAMENIMALLAAAKAGLEDLLVIVVYVRDHEDGRLVNGLLNERHPLLPKIVVHAPVCRPGWLVEIEGLAIIGASRDDLPAY